MQHIRRFAALAALALVAGGCGDGDDVRAERQDGEIVIAAVWPFSARGEVRFGEGLEMAVAEVNAAGGIGGRRLRVLREDDHESVDDGLMIAERLAENPQVTAVIGHLQSYVTVPAAATYDRAGLVLLSPASTDPELTARGYGRVFRAVATDLTTGADMAAFAEGRGYRRIAIYYVRNEYGHTLAQAFEREAARRGIGVVARASYDAEQDTQGRGFEVTLGQWKHMRVDAVYVAGEVPLAGKLIARIRAAGITVPVLGTDAMSTPVLVETGGAATEGTVVPVPFHAGERRPEVRRFVAAFQGRYGVLPDAGSALGYDAVRLLADAMRRAGSSDPEKVAAALHATRGWGGVTGAFTYDENGDLVGRRMVKAVIRGGRFEYLAEPGAAALAAAAP